MSCKKFEEKLEVEANKITYSQIIYSHDKIKSHDKIFTYAIPFNSIKN